MRRLPTTAGSVRKRRPLSVSELTVSAGRAACLVVAPDHRQVWVSGEPGLLVLTVDSPSGAAAEAYPGIRRHLVGGCELWELQGSWLLRLPHAHDQPASLVADLVSLLRPRVLRLASPALWRDPGCATELAWQVARCVSVVAAGRVAFRLSDAREAAQWRFFASCCATAD